MVEIVGGQLSVSVAFWNTRTLGMAKRRGTYAKGKMLGRMAQNFDLTMLCEARASGPYQRDGPGRGPTRTPPTPTRDFHTSRED